MLTETISGKCPCCGYDKLLQRYGSLGYFQLDGCPNCGFGYCSNHYDESGFGLDGWLDYGITNLAISEASKLVEYPKVLEAKQHIDCMNDKDYLEYQQTFDRAIEGFKTKYRSMDKTEVRKLIFEWAESVGKCDDSEKTVFKYDQEDVDKWMATNPIIFKQVIK